MGEESLVRQVLQETIAGGAMGNLRVDPQFLRINQLRGMAPLPSPHHFHNPTGTVSQNYPQGNFPNSQGNFPNWQGNFPNSQGNFPNSQGNFPNLNPRPNFNLPRPPFNTPGSFGKPSSDQPQNSSPGFQFSSGPFGGGGGRYIPFGQQGTYLVHPWWAAPGVRSGGGGWGHHGPTRIVFPSNK